MKFLRRGEVGSSAESVRERERERERKSEINRQF